MALSIRPGSTINDLMSFYKRGQGCEADPSFQDDMDEAIQVQQDPSTALFKATSNVQTCVAYGVQLFQDYGALTSAEYGALIEHLPSDLKRKGEKLSWEGPDQLSQYHVISLQGLSSDVTAGMRKARVFFNNSVTHSKNLLTPETQLLESHGDTVLRSAVTANLEERTQSLKPGSKPPSAETLKSDHLKAAAAAAAGNESAAPAPADPEQGSDQEQEDDAGGTGRKGPKRKRAAGIQVSSGKKLKPGAKGKAKAKATAKSSPAVPPRSPVRTTVPSVAEPRSDRRDRPKGPITIPHAETGSQSTAGKGKNLAKFAGDSDMRDVAEALIKIHGSSATLKSVEGLTPIAFLHEGSENAKPLTNTLNGARASTCVIVTFMLPYLGMPEFLCDVVFALLHLSWLLCPRF